MFLAILRKKSMTGILKTVNRFGMQISCLTNKKRYCAHCTTVPAASEVRIHGLVWKEHRSSINVFIDPQPSGYIVTFIRMFAVTPNNLYVNFQTKATITDIPKAGNEGKYYKQSDCEWTLKGTKLPQTNSRVGSQNLGKITYCGFCTQMLSIE